MDGMRRFRNVVAQCDELSHPIIPLFTGYGIRRHEMMVAF